MKNYIFLLFLFVTCSLIAQSRYKIATWNLEHFKEGSTRGFPEYKDDYDPPGPVYPKREAENYEYIADVIADQDFKIIALQEINGVTNSTLAGNRKHESRELEKLISYLGSSWSYIIGTEGGSQRLAFLYDGEYVDGVSFCQFNLQDESIQSKGLFDRQPIAGFFRFKKDDDTMNDLVVVNVHLASGQFRNKNHDEAMKRIVERIEVLQNNNDCFPTGEKDIVIMGDFNANRFDRYKEDFWDDMEGDGWDVLGDKKETYSPTRLSGSPLSLKNSRIDYIIISEGLDEKEVLQDQGYIHYGLVQNDPEKFRLQASDHIPISIMVKIRADND